MRREVNLIESLKGMQRAELELVVETAIRQHLTSVNAAPSNFPTDYKIAWVKGWDACGERILKEIEARLS